jgi:hypothetical protein
MAEQQTKIATRPTREFIWQRIIDFSHDYPDKKYHIYNNVHVERVVGTIRREALDHFLMISERGTGVIKKKEILSGLHHSYYLSSA